MRRFSRLTPTRPRNWSPPSSRSMRRCPTLRNETPTRCSAIGKAVARRRPGRADASSVEAEDTAIAEEPDRTAGVDKHHIVGRGEAAGAHQADEAGHALAGIDRVEQNALAP